MLHSSALRPIHPQLRAVGGLDRARAEPGPPASTRGFGGRARGSPRSSLGALGAAAVATISCFLTNLLWGLPLGGLEARGLPLGHRFRSSSSSFVPDCSVVGKVFYASYAAAGFTFLGFAALVAVERDHVDRRDPDCVAAAPARPRRVPGVEPIINYVSDVMCRTRRSRPLPVADPSYQPMVSIHIPAYNEPPEILINTIKSVEAIDYPNFEIVVLDNNTKDPAVWVPVEEYCRDRPRVKFVHVDPWPGYKAGRLQPRATAVHRPEGRDHRHGRRRRHRRSPTT